MEQRQESFILYADSVEEVLLLPIEQRGYLLTAVFNYVNGQEIPPLDLATAIVWSVWKKNIDRNNAKWEETRQRRSAAGRKGGLAAHKQAEANASNDKQGLPRQAVTVPVTVTDTVTGTVNVTGTVTESVPIADTSASSPSAPRPFLSFPLKDGREYEVSQEALNEYIQQYPLLDVPQTLNRIKDWLNESEQHLKDKSYMSEFITRWLTRDSDKVARKERKNNGTTDLSPSHPTDQFQALDGFGVVV